MRQPRLNALRIFEVAGRRLSFSKAATELHVTQAAISQQIRQLETDLGSPLFHRTHRQITLTEVGQAYFLVVQKSLRQLDAATKQFFDKGDKKPVVIRCTSSLATQWLAPQISTFFAANPGIELHFRTLDGDSGDPADRGSDIDIFSSNKADHKPDVTLLLESIITPVAGPGLLGKQKLIQAADVKAFNLIHVVGYEEGWHSWFASFVSDDDPVPQGLSADSSLFAIDATLRREGIMLGRRPFIDKYLESGELVEVFARPHNLHATYYMRQNPNSGKSAGTDEVAKWLLQLAKQ